MNFDALQQVALKASDAYFGRTGCTQARIENIHYTRAARFTLKQAVGDQQQQGGHARGNRDTDSNPANDSKQAAHHSERLADTDVKLHRVIDAVTGIERESEVQAYWTEAGEITSANSAGPLKIRRPIG